MAKTIKISDEAFETAKSHATISLRSIPKQVEYWFKIGKLAEENPDLNYKFIKEILLSKQELDGSPKNKYSLGKSVS